MLVCGVLGAAGGVLSRRYTAGAPRRSLIHGASGVAQVLSGIEGALQGVILGVIILALINLI